MPRINLLPWRAELRKQRQREFAATTGIAALAMAGVVALAHYQVELWIDGQDLRNRFLDGEIATLDKKIKEIQNLEKEKSDLLARMRIVEELQTSRPEIVHLFTELVTTLPEGVHLTKLVQQGRSITMNGVAQSNARVSSLMRNLDASAWLSRPDLKKIQAAQGSDKDAVRESQFTLVVTQTNPNAPAGEAKKK